MRFSLLFRATAVLSSFLLLQLTLLASGALCGMHAEHDGHAYVMSPHSSDANAPSAEEAAAGMPMGSCDVSGGCGAPRPPASGCSSMTSCVIVVSAGPPPRASTVETIALRLADHASFAVPLGPAVAPELPPPRV